MSDSDKLNEIKNLIVDFGQYASHRSALDVVVAIDAILDRPAAAPADEWCNCQAIHGTTTYPGPWHERGGEPHYPCAAAPAEPCGPVAPNQGASEEDSAPRRLLGWTMPDHMRFGFDGHRLSLRCTRYHFVDTTIPTMWTENPFDGNPTVGAFLRDHAHGSVVEHREDEPSDDQNAREHAEGLDRLAVEHQPAQDSEPTEEAP